MEGLRVFSFLTYFRSIATVWQPLTSSVILQGDWIPGSDLSRRLQGVQTIGAGDCAGGGSHFHLFSRTELSLKIRFYSTSPQESELRNRIDEFKFILVRIIFISHNCYNNCSDSGENHFHFSQITQSLGLARAWPTHPREAAHRIHRTQFSDERNHWQWEISYSGNLAEKRRAGISERNCCVIFFKTP